VIRLFGAGDETRDHVFIGDVVRLIGEVLQRRSRGLLNVASGHSVAFSDLAAQVAGLAGRPVRIESLPRTGPCTHRRFDRQALLAAFPSFVPTALDQGLRALLLASAND
jgi:nucleoside-diphosphate-sugar epimerase